MGKSIEELQDILLLTENDLLAIRQPETYNPITGKKGDTRKVTLDQLADYIIKAGHVAGDPHLSSRVLEPWECAKRRLLPRNGQLIEIALYPELCAAMYVGDAKNATADWWYKCDQNDTRTINGTHMRVDDPQGLALRFAGKNTKYKGANDTPYDGKNAGDYIPDSFQGHWHRELFVDSTEMSWSGSIGVFSAGNVAGIAPNGTNAVYIKRAFSDGVHGTPRISHETAGASFSLLLYIFY